LSVILAKELDTNFKYDVAESPGGETIKRCFACGACTGGCLISEQEEEFDPRKIIRKVLLGMRKEVLSSPYLWSCLMCHNCSFYCPQGVKFSEIVGVLREMAVKEGFVRHPLLQRLMLHNLLPFPGRMELITRPVSLYESSGLQALVRRSKVLGRLSEKIGNWEYLIPPFPINPLRDRLKEVMPPRGEVKQRVGYFMGCCDNFMFTSMALATISVLHRNSCEVVVPRGQKCCGMPCNGYGEIEQARKLARHNIEAFEKTGVDIVVTDCATCGSTLKAYATFLQDDPEYAERALAFSRKVQDLSEFLAGVVTADHKLGEVKGTVTYHDSCHLLRDQKISQQPRQLINLIPGLEFVEMKESDRCCGGAGIYNLTHYKNSMSILKRKMGNIADTGADLIATGCLGCQVQLGMGVRWKGLKAKIVHPVELLEQAYKSGEGK